MIEVNLIAKKKTSRLPTLMGVDLNLINLKALGIAFVAGYAIKIFLEYSWENDYKTTVAAAEAVKQEIKEFDEKTKDTKDLKKVLDTYTKQMVKLKEREKVVEEVLKKRSNPRALFERLARNTPSDLWFTTLTILPDAMLEIKGRSLSYKSIGDFSVMVKDSRFFGGRKLELKASETVEEKEGESSRRVESFTLTGKVDSF